MTRDQFLDSLPYWIDQFGVAVMLFSPVIVLGGAAVVLWLVGSALHLRGVLAGQHQREMDFRMKGAEVLRGR